MKFDDKLNTFLIAIINLYNPKRRTWLSKPIMSYSDKSKFFAVFSLGIDSKEYMVGTEPESLAGALASLHIMANKLGNDFEDMVIKFLDTKKKLIMGFVLVNGEFAAFVGEDYISEKENSTFRMA